MDSEECFKSEITTQVGFLVQKGFDERQLLFLPSCSRKKPGLPSGLATVGLFKNEQEWDMSYFYSIFLSFFINQERSNRNRDRHRYLTGNSEGSELCWKK